MASTTKPAEANTTLKPESESKPEPRDDERFNTGDFSLISSDNVRFRIASHRLLSASKVFLDASTVTGDGERVVYLSDNIIEDKYTLGYCFRLIHDGDWSQEECNCEDISPATVHCIIQFFKKYDCEHWVRVALHVIHSNYHRKQIDFQTALVAACVGEDVEMVTNLLDVPLPRWDPPSGHASVFLCEDDVSEHDLRGFSILDWEMIPPRFAFAITRVMTAAEKMSLKHSRGWYFRKIMEDMADVEEAVDSARRRQGA